MRIALLLFMVVFSSSIYASSYSKTDRKGWFWYEKKEKKKEKVAKETKPLKSDRITHRQILKNQGKKWEESVSKAILNPSNENIREYIVQTERINNQAEKFATNFERFIWMNPKHDYSIENPTNTLAIIAKNKDYHNKLNQNVHEISKKYGIIFFFTSSCSVCKYFAPILKRFSEEYNLNVLPVSLDGKGIPEYPKVKKNFYLANKLNLKVTPTTYLIDPETDEVAPISYGMASTDEFKVKIIDAYRRIKSE